VTRALLERIYGTVMLVLAVLLLGLYLVCMVDGVISLCLYENVSGLGLMAVGVLLYAGGALALEETRAHLRL
jgi:hypothetical protein